MFISVAIVLRQSSHKFNLLIRFILSENQNIKANLGEVEDILYTIY